MTNISAAGIWLLLDERELHLPFAKFPWFRSATVGQILNIERPSPHHLHWPDLDLDLAVDSIERPERYPLVSASPPVTASEPRAHTTTARRGGKRRAAARTGSR